MDKVTISVHKKGERYREPGEFIKTINRKVWIECFGNFNPMYCRYQGKKQLVQSRDGDLSDPLRRTDEYMKTLFIEITDDVTQAASIWGRAGGSAKSERKTASSRENGKLGGRPKKIVEVK